MKKHTMTAALGGSIVVVALAVLLSAGCAFKGDKPASSGGDGGPTGGVDGNPTTAPSGGAGADKSGGGPVWRIKPVRLRIYPSTRFVREKGTAVLEARIELLDDAGDPIKGVGDFRFDLFGLSRAGQAPMGQRLYSWDVSMLTLEANRQHYEITRTYLFRLKLDDLSLAQAPVQLQVAFMPPGGERLVGNATIGPEGVINPEPVPDIK
jgi:hypothetical protein